MHLDKENATYINMHTKRETADCGFLSYFREPYNDRNR